MPNMTNTINVNVSNNVKEEARVIALDLKQQPSKEFSEALDEVRYIDEHPTEHKIYHNVDKLFEDILDKE